MPFFRHVNGEVMDPINCATCIRITQRVLKRGEEIVALLRSGHRSETQFERKARQTKFTLETLALSTYIAREHKRDMRKEERDAARRPSVTRRRTAKAPLTGSRSRSTSHAR